MQRRINRHQDQRVEAICLTVLQDTFDNCSSQKILLPNAILGVPYTSARLRRLADGPQTRRRHSIPHP